MRGRRPDAIFVNETHITGGTVSTDYKFEAVVIPVTDVDKAKAFYQQLDWRLDAACARGPEAGEWLQQATLAIRAPIPLDVQRDTIQPFPTFSEIYVAAIKSLTAMSKSSDSPSHN
jgi:hypothetical protein